VVPVGQTGRSGRLVVTARVPAPRLQEQRVALLRWRPVPTIAALAARRTLPHGTLFLESNFGPWTQVALGD
jgi:hypothetical protein